MDDTSKLLVMLLAALGVGFAVFMILREVMCWYYKINRMVSLLEDIRDVLRKDGGPVAAGAGRVTELPGNNAGPEIRPPKDEPCSCAACGTPTSPNDKFCPKCGASLG
jgi:hypothetical protein